MWEWIVKSSQENHSLEFIRSETSPGMSAGCFNLLSPSKGGVQRDAEIFASKLVVGKGGADADWSFVDMIIVALEKVEKGTTVS